MIRALAKVIPALAGVVGTAMLLGAVRDRGDVRMSSIRVPDPVVDMPLAPRAGQANAVVAGGCFWGLQAVFQHVRGVTHVTSGYAGGDAKTAHYDEVSSGTTGHAESVQITYDPSQITYGQLLKVFFSVAHDPTQVDRQGPDDGTQYRSVIFFSSPDQQRVAQAYIAQLDQGKIFPRRIATQVVALPGFYAAEDYHQDYATKHPNSMYILVNDHPKVLLLQSEWPKLYRDPLQQ
ncbi:MAG TPA: peptide-methionine (S)-S-oxide reductase MsrA [Gemmatimonadaceae bacterium]|nr:peptide-methionine (S)-S-oxide reductase MsrA [Gemmatimonadaceae bacterium]